MRDREAGATYGDALFGIGIIALLLAVYVLVRGARRGLGDGQPRYRRPAHRPMAGLRRRSDAGARPHGQTVVSPAATQSLISYIAKHDMIQDSAGFPAFLLLLIMQIAVTVTLIRSRTIPLWVPILFVVGMVVETG